MTQHQRRTPVPPYQRAATRQLELVERVTERYVADEVRLAYEDAEMRIHRRARRNLPRDAATAARMLRARYAVAHAALAEALRDAFSEAEHTAALEATEGLRAFLRDMEPSSEFAVSPLALDRSTVAHRQVRERDLSRSLELWQQRVAQALERALRTGEEPVSVELLAARAERAVEEQEFVLRRAARTGASFTAHASIDAAIIALARQYPDVRKRWTERVSDVTHDALDNVVGEDSMELHGQVVGVREAFVMPPAELVPAVYWGDKWYFPPNRPNDRATVLPWRPSWGVPGWRLEGTKRVPL